MKPTLLVSLILSLSALHAGAQDFVTHHAGRRIVLQADTTQTSVKLADLQSVVADAQKQEIQKIRPAGWARLVRPTAAAQLSPQQKATQARATLSALSKNSKAAFVSPVLRSTEGHELSPTESLLVKLKPGQTMPKFLQALRNPAITSVRQISRDGVYKVSTNLRDGAAVMDLAATLVTHPMVKMAQADFRHSAVSTLVPNDPGFFANAGWGLDNVGSSNGLAGFDMKAVKAWDVTTGSNAIIVAVFDGGIQQNHPEINQIPGRDFTDEPIANGGTRPGNVPGHDHGVMVASCISARVNNSLGACGIAPDVRCVSVRFAIPFLRDDGKIGIDGSDSAIIEGLEWAESIGARVSVHSYSFFPSWAADEVFQSTRDAGMIHFASTGNGVEEIPFYSLFPFIGWPASSPSVLGVGAANRSGSRSTFSQFSGDTRRVAQSVDFMAPGEQVAVVLRTGVPDIADGRTVSASGTSFAAPYAAGVAALILSQKPSLTPAQVERLMIDGCRDMGASGWDRFTGFGLVDAFKSLPDDHGDTLATATRINASSTNRGFLNRDNDTDCLRFTLPTHAIMNMHTASLIGSVPTAQVNVEVLNENGTAASFVNITPTSQIEINRLFPGSGISGFKLRAAMAPGNYVIRIKGFNSAQGSYNLTLNQENAHPEITVLGNNILITDGDTTPESGDHTSFGTTRPGVGVSRTFTIRNDGHNILRISNASNIDGNRVPLTQVTPVTTPAGGVRDIPVPQPTPVPAPVHFRVTTSPVSQIMPGRSTTFTVVFKPVGTGFFNHTLKIESDDQDERSFDFVISGASLFTPGSVTLR
jgi:subtilisin family serine protease